MAAKKKAAIKKKVAAKKVARKKKVVVKKESAPAAQAPKLIDQRIRDLGGWHGQTLARMRALILDADPAITEEWKWGVPVWTRGGIICTGESYSKVVKLTFANGAALADPAGLFNSSLIHVLNPLCQFCCGLCVRMRMNINRWIFCLGDFCYRDFIN